MVRDRLVCRIMDNKIQKRLLAEKVFIKTQISMVNAAKGFLYLQSGTAHVETINKVDGDEKPLKDKSIMKCCY